MKCDRAPNYNHIYMYMNNHFQYQSDARYMCLLVYMSLPPCYMYLCINTYVFASVYKHIKFDRLWQMHENHTQSYTSHLMATVYTYNTSLW